MSVKQVALKADSPAVLVLSFEGEGIQRNSIAKVGYDGNGGVQTKNATVSGFDFSPTNMSSRIDYSPLAIAMNFNGDPGTRRAFAWYTNMEETEYAPEGIMDSLVQVVDANQDFTSPDTVTYNGTSELIHVQMNNKGIYGTYVSHKVISDDLKPGTAYKYRVGSGAVE